MKRAAKAFAERACDSPTLHVLGTSPKGGKLTGGSRTRPYGVSGSCLLISQGPVPDRPVG